ncbi:MAG: hypothetical protein IJA10_10410 [Lachnospiraceae bacterium]|nr:hypothetical protein [Lachnospiraceae bacterium]
MANSFLDLVGANLLKDKIIEKIPTKVSELENDSGFTTNSSASTTLPQDCVMTFNDDGTITETTDNCTITTEFVNSKTIKETYAFSNGTTKVKTTTFSDDGKQISEVVS